MPESPTSRTQHLQTPRTARYHVLGELGPRTKEVWFVLHGYGQRADAFLRPFDAVASAERVVVAPEALSRFYLDDAHRTVGASWMTRADRAAEIEDYVRYLDALHLRMTAGHPRAAVHVLGFSQGGATACRWAALGTVRPRRLTLWAGGVPPDLNLQTHGDPLRDARVTLVAGTEDPYVTAERLQEAVGRLAAHGIRPQVRRFEGGHRLSRSVLRILAEEGA